MNNDNEIPIPRVKRASSDAQKRATRKYRTANRDAIVKKKRELYALTKDDDDMKAKRKILNKMSYQRRIIKQNLLKINIGQI